MWIWWCYYTDIVLQGPGRLSLYNQSKGISSLLPFLSGLVRWVFNQGWWCLLCHQGALRYAEWCGEEHCHQLELLWKLRLRLRLPVGKQEKLADIVQKSIQYVPLLLFNWCHLECFLDSAHLSNVYFTWYILKTA